MPFHRDFAHVMKSRNLKGDHPVLSRWAHCNHKGPYENCPETDQCKFKMFKEGGGC